MSSNLFLLKKYTLYFYYYCCYIYICVVLVPVVRQLYDHFFFSFRLCSNTASAFVGDIGRGDNDAATKVHTIICAVQKNPQDSETMDSFAHDVVVWIACKIQQHPPRQHFTPYHPASMTVIVTKQRRCKLTLFPHKIIPRSLPQNRK